jgi:hypothetical protein
MLTSRLVLRILIYFLVLATFFLGMPHIHYAVALMVAVIIRHKDSPGGLLAPVQSSDFGASIKQ